MNLDLSKNYNRKDFTRFIYDFLPDDFQPEEEQLYFDGKKLAEGWKLGSSEDLDLTVYEFRTNISDKRDPRVTLTREVTRIMENQKSYSNALVVFYSKESKQWRLSLITTDFNRENGKPKRLYSNPRRFSFLLGENSAIKTPTQFLIEKGPIRQRTENKKTLTPKEDLLSRFSIEALTKEFYQKLYSWYLWAVDGKTGVTFPNDINTDQDDRENLNIKIIRLITRMLFIWFIKQKHLVPENLFDVDFLKNILKDFNENASDNGDYYNAILQNLFFATLNQEIDGRKLFTTYKGRSSYYSNKQLYRDTDKSYFTFPLDQREKRIIDLFKEVPYLNGGLFECLDKYELDENDKIKQVTNYDGFSHDNSKFPNGNFKKKAFVPNELFFAAEHDEILTVEGNPQTIKVMGLIELFKLYNFTVEENTTSDKEVSLDPELLGCVFENLLAAYNPETKESARKSTGSYYTPREIVDYMVDESLIAYLSGECGHDAEKMQQLVKEEQVSDITDPEQIIADLKKIKILDPACGSGAFPMGILLKITDIIEKLTPEEHFNRYQTKLDIIKNCIYGVDIQAIAMLICKLRFFISLICDCDKDETKPNFGIIPLPNLETKFVAANSLLLPKVKEFDNDWTRDEHLQKLQKELLDLRLGIFDLRTHDAKKNNKLKDREKCREIEQYIKEKATKPNEEKIAFGRKTIAKLEEELLKYQEDRWEDVIETQTTIFGTGEQTVLRRNINKEKRDEINSNIRDLRAIIYMEEHKTAAPSFTQAVEQVTHWNPYDQNSVSPFFDPEWMFGVKYGFDIVIGNPPYISAPMQVANAFLAEQRRVLADSKRYKSLFQKWDLYIPFIELGIQLNKRNGICTMIVPFPLTNQLYAKVLRKMLVEENEMFELVDLNGTKVFENATVSNCIPFIRKASWTEKTWISNIDENRQIHRILEKPVTELVQDTKTYVWNVTEEKRETNRHADMHVLGDYCYISKGMVLNSDEKAEDEKFVKADLISETQDEIHCKKYIEGKDLERYEVKRIRYLEYGTNRSPEKLSRPTFEELYTNQKLLINSLGDLKASVDLGEFYYCEQQVRMGLLWKDLHGVENNSITTSIKKFSTMSREDMEKLSETVDLRYLLGIMNSKYASVLLTNIRGGDYHITPEHIRNIPIPEAMPEQQMPIIILVDYILFLKAKNQLPIAALFFDAVINSLVYDIYLEDETIKHDLYVSDFVPKYLTSFEADMSDEDKLRLCEEVYKSMKDNDALSRAIINRKNLNVIKIIQGAKNE